LERTGWICPICGKGISPYEKQCPCGERAEVLRNKNVRDDEELEETPARLRKFKPPWPCPGPVPWPGDNYDPDETITISKTHLDPEDFHDYETVSDRTKPIDKGKRGRS